MKIIVGAPYIFIKGHKYGEKNQSGLAYVIRDITDALSEKKLNVSVFTQSILTKKTKINNWLLHRKKIIDLIFNCKFFYLKRALVIIKDNNFDFKKKLKIFYYFLSGSYFEKIIKTNKPDLVHIHTISLYTLPFIYACIKTKTNFLITLHGLVSFTEQLNTSEFEKMLERKFLKLIVDKDIEISVISTGIKKRIFDFVERKSSNINVILNGLNFYKDNNSNNSNSNKFSNKKQLLCVGSINKNKNQLQTINAVNRLNKKNYDINLTIIGDGPYFEKLKNYVKKYNLKFVTFTGRISRKKVKEYYRSSDLLIVASYDEGFGLPIIEAYNYGLPVVIFSDLDAVKDLYHRRAMLKIKNRSTKSLVQGIEKAVNKNWSSEFIKKFSNQFHFKEIVNDYIKLYKKIDNVGLNINNIDDIIRSKD